VNEVAPVGLPEAFLRLWTENHALFPRGIDLVLTAGSRFLCLPRTTKIIATEM
jgi:alpha-D-ribose 1-methylphosphonate 5-triphosphate synthase subunit PhnH